MAEEGETIIQRPRESFELTRFQVESDFQQFLDHPLTAAIASVTGAFALGAKHLGVAAGRMAQAIVKGQIYEQFAEELRALYEAGKIPDDLGKTQHGLYTWSELMRIIDEECPDAERLKALKAAFYAVNKIASGDADRIVEYQLWQVAKEMRSGDVLLLRTIYTEFNRTPNGYHRIWAEHIAKASGLILIELLARYEKHLIDLLLITPRFKVGGDLQHGPESGIDATNNRLTQLGLRFCKNLETYEIDLGLSGNTK